MESKEHIPSESLWHQAVRNTLQKITEGEKFNTSDDRLSKVFPYLSLLAFLLRQS